MLPGTDINNAREILVSRASVHVSDGVKFEAQSREVSEQGKSLIMSMQHATEDCGAQMEYPPLRLNVFTDLTTL